MTMPTTNPNDADPAQRQQTPEARRAAFYADGLTSWEEYQQDRWYLEWEEVRLWLASWGDDDAHIYCSATRNPPF